MVNYANKIKYLESLSKRIEKFKQLEKKIKSAIGNHGGCFYWSRNKLINQALLNYNNGFLLWLNNEIGSVNKERENAPEKISKLRKLIENYYEEKIEVNYLC